jgi:iron(III) transport system ATP-binding protein
MASVLTRRRSKAADAEAPQAAPAANPQRVMVRLAGLTKRYQGQTQPAVDGISLDILQGEIFSLVGPSGCGKTTTLRMIAGLEQPDAGRIEFDGKPIYDRAKRLSVPPEDREVGMVFQSYAIWPHMTVEENVAYPLKVKRRSSGEIRQRVASALQLVGLDHLASRSAMSLSGGQQQRVALARALVYEPALLLLDEPFSNLDAKLREQMRVELKVLQAKIGVTVLFVTHDQVEALSLSSRMAILDGGRVQQVGTPRELYDWPANEVVRDFLGSSVVLDAVCEGRAGDGRALVRVNGGTNTIALACDPALAVHGRDVACSVRPEDIVIHHGDARPADTDTLTLTGTIEAQLFTGERTELRVLIPGQEAMLVYGHRRDTSTPGSTITLTVAVDCLRLWPGRSRGAADAG